MASLWLDRPTVPEHTLPVRTLPADQHCEVAIVGAGLTGLTLAVLLARAGVSVVVVEAAYVGAGTTGHTTAKISLLQGTRLSTIAAKHPTETLRNYVEANREGQAWLLHYCDEHDVPYETAPALTYAGTSEGRRSVEQEAEACGRADLPVTVIEDAGLPFPTHGAVRLADQAQFDPMDALRALVDDFIAREGRLYENAPSAKGRSDRIPARAGDGCGRRLRRHCRAGHRDPHPGPGRLLRPAGTAALVRPGVSRTWSDSDRHVPVRGLPHSVDPVGAARRTASACWSAATVTSSGATSPRRIGSRTSAEWTKRHFPGAELTHAWSAQDYRAVDDLPYVGPLLPWSENVLFASGFAKWGMTNAVAAALALSSRLLGGATSWAPAFESWSPHELKGVFDAAKANASVAVELGKGWLRPKAAAPTVQPGDGEGVVERSGLRPVAVCAVDGRTSRVSAVCTHLGGVVTWNDAERSWDCPLHGSRFSADGAVLEGPATRDLAPAPQS